MKAFFKIIRWPNLLIIVLVQYLIRFFIIESLNVPHVLNHLYFFLGVLCSISLAAAGYIINDIYDLDTDSANKPERMAIGKGISLNNSWGLYVAFNIIAIISGYLVAHEAGMPNLWLLPPVAIALLYLYSVDLKKRPLIGNLLISLLTGLPVFLVALFDVLPAASVDTASIIQPVFYVILGYALFASYTNLVREIIKDAEDIEGDMAQGYRTLAILTGRSSIRYVIIGLLFILLACTLAFNYYISESDPISAIYLGLFVNIPIVYLMIKVWKAKTKIDFKKSSILLKIIMLTGIVSMVVFTLSLKSRF